MKNRRSLITPALLSLLLIVSLVWGYNQYQIRKSHELALENHYQNLFFDVKKHLDNVQVNLGKALVASSKEQNIVLFSQIMNEAFSAHSKLGQMPISHAEVGNTEKFLNQAADYSAYLIQRHLQGEGVTDEQRKALNDLKSNSVSFNKELAKVQQELSGGNFLLGSMSSKQRKGIEEANKDIFQTSLVNTEKQMGEMPELIYDGPFSDQMLHRKPVGLPNQDVSLEEAMMKGQEFFGKNRIKDIEVFEEGEHINETRMPAYTFHIYPNNQQKDLAVYMGVSKKGGKVLWMANPRPVSKASLSVKNAEDKALQYLRDKGFENMKANYSLKYNGAILFNFTASQDDVIIYPDLVKVKVALDTGEVVGFDAAAYYMNHRERNIEIPHLDETEARSKVKTNFDIDSVRLTIIPKGKNEILCYEFKGKYEGSDYIVYINALDGREENILQIIKDENGTLTF